jgi:hypothetical protein
MGLLMKLKEKKIQIQTLDLSNGNQFILTALDLS